MCIVQSKFAPKRSSQTRKHSSRTCTVRFCISGGGNPSDADPSPFRQTPTCMQIANPPPGCRSPKCRNPTSNTDSPCRQTRPPPPVNRQTGVKTLPSPKARLRAVIEKKENSNWWLVESYLSSCFCLFAPNFGKVAGTYE